jgi:TrmH family RNA methyltransferase
MLSHNQAKHIRSLKLAKFRKANGQFIAEGVKLAEELIQSKFEVLEVFALEPWIEKNREKLHTKNISIHPVKESELSRISLLSTPNEVLLVVKMQGEEKEISISDITLYLDRIQDPGNMGTIIRTADWFGINDVVCSPGCADIYNPKVVQSTMGSIARVKVIEKEPVEFFEKLGKGAHVFGTMMEGEDIFQAELNIPAIVVIGNESQGISQQLTPFISKNLRIPGWSDKAESLNASVATGVVLAEFRRRPG